MTAGMFECAGDDHFTSSPLGSFFTEHHRSIVGSQTTGSPMQFHGWGDAAGRTGSTLSDTYRLLLRLRQLGIRAHSWA